MKLTRIRIPSTWQLGPDDFSGGVADFKLGLGPCGLFVSELSIDNGAEGVQVIQVCSDHKGNVTQKKAFFYQWSQITGRVEMTYA